MGQACEPCFQPNSTTVNEVSESYLKLIQSVKVEEQFPQQCIPETVKQKIRLLNVKLDFNRSELWKYQQPKTNSSDEPFVIYTVINNDDIVKSVQPIPESQQFIVATSQHPLSSSQNTGKLTIFNSYGFTEAAIFLFKSKGKDNDHSNPYAQNSYQNLEFEQFYFGPVNEKMSQPHASKIFKTGEYYQGNMKDSSLEGQGIMINALGNHSYNGSWSKNKPQGHGVEQLDGKFNYHGLFSNGKWNGPGKLTLLNSNNPLHLQGNFVNGSLEGHGTVRNRLNELVYEGQFKNGKQHGKGTWYGSNGDKYQGDFLQGRKQGKGKFIFSSGNIYTGSFKNGRPQGQGVLTKGGISTRGHWFNGQNILVLKDNNENYK